MPTQVPSLPQQLARELRPSVPSCGLTSRELEVVELVVDGLTNVEIGLRLFISARTVQSHLASAMRKLRARSRTHLAVTALRSGIVPLGPVVFAA